MTKVKNLEKEIQDLNRLLLDMNDQLNGLGIERDKYKKALQKLIEMILTAEDPQSMKKYVNTELKQLL